MKYEDFKKAVIAEVEKIGSYKVLGISLEDYLKRQNAERYIKSEYESIGALPWKTELGALDAVVSCIEMD